MPTRLPDERCLSDDEEHRTSAESDSQDEGKRRVVDSGQQTPSAGVRQQPQERERERHGRKGENNHGCARSGITHGGNHPTRNCKSILPQQGQGENGGQGGARGSDEETACDIPSNWNLGLTEMMGGPAAEDRGRNENAGDQQGRAHQPRNRPAPARQGITISHPILDVRAILPCAARHAGPEEEPGSTLRASNATAMSAPAAASSRPNH